jgi:hypothetical protein
MDFRYLVEVKNEFNNFMNNILSLHIYNGINGMLDYSINMSNLIKEKQEKDESINNPGIITIFKMCLSDITTLNNYEIENEYQRIKEKSECSEWFDNLIKACFKSYILLLTWDPEQQKSKFSDNDFYEKISIKDFIHRCYIESCNYFHNHPDIFFKKNVKKDIFDIIDKCITIAIKKTIPYNKIIEEYLKIQFNNINIENKNSIDIENVKSLVNKMITTNKYGRLPTVENLIDEKSSSSSNN